MAIFVISNLQTSEFEFEGIKFEKLNPSVSIEKQWMEEHTATFKAVVDDDMKLKPIIVCPSKDQPKLIDSIHDICLLLSLVQSTVVYCPEYTINNMTRQRRRFPRQTVSSFGLVANQQINSFLTVAVATLRRSPNFVNDTGFMPAAYLLATSFDIALIDARFSLVWTALEALTISHCKKQESANILPSKEFDKFVKPSIEKALKMVELPSPPSDWITVCLEKIGELNRPSICRQICKFRDSYSLDFFTDDLLQSYTRLRNSITHQGDYGEFPREKVVQISSKLSRSVQLALFHLLGCLEQVENLDKLKEQIIHE